MGGLFLQASHYSHKLPSKVKMIQFSITHSGNALPEVAKNIQADLFDDGFSGNIEYSGQSVILNVSKIYNSRIVLQKEKNTVLVTIAHENGLVREAKRFTKQPVKFFFDSFVDLLNSTKYPSRMATSFVEDEQLLQYLKKCVKKCFKEI